MFSRKCNVNYNGGRETFDGLTLELTLKKFEITNYRFSFRNFYRRERMDLYLDLQIFFRTDEK